MTQDRPLPLFATLTQDSPREEVLAALAEIDEVDAQLATPVFPETRPGATGCVWSEDGMAVACRGGYIPNPVREAQDRAGEEDQSVDGWESA